MFIRVCQSNFSRGKTPWFLSYSRILSRRERPAHKQPYKDMKVTDCKVVFAEFIWKGEVREITD